MEVVTTNEAENQEVETQENAQEAVNENPEIETEADSENENDSEENESEDSENSEDEAPKPKKNGFKKRIDKLNSKISKAQEEAEYWREQALKRNAEKESKEIESKPKNEGRPNQDDFDDYADYVDALTDYKVEQKIKAQEENQARMKAQESQRQKAEEWQKRVSDFSSQTPDFEEVMEDAEDVTLSSSVQEAILDSELGAHILYELAKDPENAIRINNLPATAATREIGKIEGKIQALEKTTTKTKTTTKAPRPLTSVRGSGKVAKNLSDPNLSQAEYEALREKQLAGKAS